MAPYTEALAGNGLAVTYALDETITHYGMRMLANYGISYSLASRVPLLSPGR